MVTTLVPATNFSWPDFAQRDLIGQGNFFARHARRKSMELTIDAVSILSPNEMRVLRKQMAGMTLRRLSAESKISIPQLSRYECATNGLTPQQLRTCEKVLLAAARERSQALSKLLAPEDDRVVV
jgi:hypothetical protein